MHNANFLILAQKCVSMSLLMRIHLKKNYMVKIFIFFLLFQKMKVLYILESLHVK